ncbi:cytochrome c oxidase assembly protein [Kytococcus sedentarius]|uniref:cytochrome c oxidase assembly protein n=1 Tax=Kytococcus sedentarius TaxID=1276 RepID=UPI003851764F
MIPAHGGHTHAAGSGTDWGVVVPVVALLVVAAGYVALALLRRRDHRGWSGWRTVSFVTGIALLVAGLVPALIPLPDGTFVVHMYQHLLIGMYAPLALVLGAPATLLLRSVPHRYGRVIGRLLGSVPMGVLAHPVTALVLNVGGLYLLYTTPLYQATLDNPALHHVVHLHFFLAGYLFAYSIAGPDPAPHRPSVPARLVVLGVAILGHAVLAQLLYAGVLVHVQAPAHDLKAGADLMYYAGDIAELLLALAMVSTWRPEPGRRPAGRRRAGATQPATAGGV